MTDVLFLTGQLGRGGAEQQLVVLIRALRAEGVSCEVAVWNYSEHEVHVAALKHMGVAVLPLLGPRPWHKVMALRRLVREHGARVLHSYTFFTNAPAAVAAWGLRVRCVGSVRSNFTFDQVTSGAWRGWLCAVLPQRQIFNSAAAAKTAAAAPLWARPLHRHVVRNGIDLQALDATPVRDELPRLLLAVGSLFPVKRWDVLLQAAVHLRQHNVPFHLRLAGDGPERATLHDLRERLGLQEHVTLLGARSDVAQLLTQAYAAVHTADIEGCPNAVMEAMALGRPVVATAAGDVPSLVEDGVCGYVVPCGDAAALAERLKTLLSDAALAARFGAAARVRAQNILSITQLVTGTLAVYRAAGWREAACADS